MDTEMIFRVVLPILLVGFMVHRGYYTRKQGQAGRETMKQREEGAASKIAGLLGLVGFVAWYSSRWWRVGWWKIAWSSQNRSMCTATSDRRGKAWNRACWTSSLTLWALTTGSGLLRCELQRRADDRPNAPGQRAPRGHRISRGRFARPYPR